MDSKTEFFEKDGLILAGTLPVEKVALLSRGFKPVEAKATATKKTARTTKTTTDTKEQNK